MQQQGHQAYHKWAHSLLRLMGLEAIYPRPKLSQPAPGHRIYPYLLRDVKIERVNQVWSRDITYVRLVGGFVYLVAIIDWFSRYVAGVGNFGSTRQQFLHQRFGAGGCISRSTTERQQQRMACWLETIEAAIHLN